MRVETLILILRSAPQERVSKDEATSTAAERYSESNRKEPVKINDVSRTRCSTSVARWCTAEPGPRLYIKKPGSRVSSASFHAALRPGHKLENPESFPARLSG
jgi:hypothetical protein